MRARGGDARRWVLLVGPWIGAVAAMVWSAPVRSAAAARPTTTAASTATSTIGVDAILGRATDRSVTISVHADRPTDVAVDFGTSPTRLTSRTAVQRTGAAAATSFVLSSLRPDQQYHYRLRTRPVGRSTYTTGAVHRFHTQRPQGSTFTFTIDADPHYGDDRFDESLYRVALGNARAAQPDFHIDLGDTFMTEKQRPTSYEAASGAFLAMRPILGEIGADAPLYLVNGNHEGELGWLKSGPRATELPVWSTRLRQAWYPNPVPGTFFGGASIADQLLGGPRDSYYSWTWGDALFVVLDPFWYTTDKPRPDAAATGGNWGWTLGRAQYDWLRATLESSTTKHRFVFIHHLVGGASEARGGVEVAGLYEWGGHNADGSDGFAANRPGWGVPIHQLLVQNHVDAVFHGHDHVYVKQELDGIVYHELPQPSVTSYDNTRIAAEEGYLQGEVLGSSGHLVVTVEPTKATVRYVRAYRPQDERTDRRNGTVAATYVITR